MSGFLVTLFVRSLDSGVRRVTPVVLPLLMGSEAARSAAGCVCCIGAGALCRSFSRVCTSIYLLLLMLLLRLLRRRTLYMWFWIWSRRYRITDDGLAFCNCPCVKVRIKVSDVRMCRSWPANTDLSDGYRGFDCTVRKVPAKFFQFDSNVISQRLCQTGPGFVGLTL